MNELLRHILESGVSNTISEAEVKELQARFPSFTLPALMAVESRTATPEMTARVAVALPDMDALSRITGEDAGLFANFYPEPEPATPSTIETIDTFLATYGPGNAHETEALEKAIFNPVPDYAAMLAAEEGKSVPAGDELDENVVGAETAAINRFIAENKGRTVLPAEDHDAPAKTEEEARKPVSEDKKPARKAASTQNADSGNLSESFARIMIKNGNYAKALAIISDLYLNNPEKSVYFADQIRFLRKLIVNDNKKQ